MLKHCIRDQRGLTLIELLAVVVILGIIAAIAVPSIGALIDNSRVDAHVANARQMISGAKIAIASDQTLVPNDTESIHFSLTWLEDNGYLEVINSPDNVAYARLGTAVDPSGTIGDHGNSYVTVARAGNAYTYSVKLVNNAAPIRGVRSASGGVTSGAALTEDNLDRDSVQ